MRIIAGLAKGKNLFSPSDKTRPTSDRAREGLFSSLESEFGSMADLDFLDLYSGSGAVGISTFLPEKDTRLFDPESQYQTSPFILKMLWALIPEAITSTSSMFGILYL